MLLGEPARAEVEAILRRRPPPHVSAINLAEVIDKLVRIVGRDEADVNDSIDLLIVGGLEVQPFWLPETRRAAAIRAKHYQRTESPISLADSACLATAMILGAGVATSDGPLARVARALGIDVTALPDSNGRRPSAA